MSSVVPRQGFSQGFHCGFDDNVQAQTLPDTTVTIEGQSIDSIKESCALIYLPVNLHFFLEDDCSEGIQPANLDGITYVSPCEADDIAGEIIDALNYSHQYMSDNPLGYNEQWNGQHWNAPVSGPVCIPFRFVLVGVHIHCDSEIRNKQNEHISDYAQFDVDPSSTFNIYIADVNLAGQAGANGYTAYGSGRTIVETIEPDEIGNLLSHEFSHMLGLKHAFDDDNCNDTWGEELADHLNAYHDLNCNGIRDSGEGIKTCWSNDNDPYCIDPQACDYHPCCQWEWQDNNVMTYSSWASNHEYSAYTDCQITRALIGLGSFHNGKIQAVDPTCLPATSVISKNPVENRLLFTSASRNYDEYKIDILSTSGSLIKTTGWRTGMTTRYRLSDDPSLTPGMTYVARLHVSSSCGSMDDSEVLFVQPSATLSPTPGECEMTEPYIPPLELALSPNPIESGQLTVSFELPYSSTVQIYRIPVLNPGASQLEYNSSQALSGPQQVQLNSGQWASGVYGIYIIAGDLTDYQLLIKSN